MKTVRYRRYPAFPPYRKEMLPVSGGHTLYVEESGNPDGMPILIVHGGPGYALPSGYNRRLDPKKWRIIYFEQRGCGRSKPFASIHNNTTQDLIEDIEIIRKHMQISQWVVTGGSWGSTLSLLYAQAHPERVLSLLVSGIFLGERDEIDWFFSELGLPRLRYEQFVKIQDVLGCDLWGRALETRLFETLNASDQETALKAAQEWCIYEGLASKLFPRAALTRREVEEDQNTLALARLELHYFQENCFLKPGQILKNAKRLSGIPTYILQGQQDMVCPSMVALRLKKVMPHARCYIVDDSDHYGSGKLLQLRRNVFNTIYAQLNKNNRERAS